MTEFQFDVFLSHNAKDNARVRRLEERLRVIGIRVWFVKPGDDRFLGREVR